MPTTPSGRRGLVVTVAGVIAYVLFILASDALGSPWRVLALLASLGTAMDDVAARATADWLRTHFAAAAWIAVELLRDGTERAHLAALTKLARDSELPLVAAGAVCMHERARRRVRG